MRAWLLAPKIRSSIWALIILLAPALASAQFTLLRNDGHEPPAAMGFQGGFVVGEMAASRFVAPSEGRQLTSVDLAFGDAS